MSKPTGHKGAFHVQIGTGGQAVGAFEQIPFSKEKATVESEMVRAFFSSMNNRLSKTGEKFFLSDPKSNEENDFDFTVASPRGPAYLELMEIAPLQGPYEKAPASYKPYEFAKPIFEGILEKSRRYPADMGRDLFLLLYVTHWTFALSDTVVACLRYWLLKQPTVFRAIFSYQPLDRQAGIPHWLFPVPSELIGLFDPEDIRENVCFNVDLRNAELKRERENSAG